jgi:hypothetical protein
MNTSATKSPLLYQRSRGTYLAFKSSSSGPRREPGLDLDLDKEGIMARPGNGAFAALALAGLAYLFKNRQQLGSKLQELSGKVQNQLNGSHSQPARLEEPKAYTGETTRM